MKSVFVAICLLISATGFSQAIKKETFKVDGACGMCKKHIETAAKGQPGVSKAIWNQDTKMLSVVYAPSKISVDSIQSKIAAAGYDTPKFKATSEAYQALDECCQYDRTPATADKKDNPQ